MAPPSRNGGVVPAGPAKVVPAFTAINTPLPGEPHTGGPGSGTLAGVAALPDLGGTRTRYALLESVSY